MAGLDKQGSPFSQSYPLVQGMVPRNKYDDASFRQQKNNITFDNSSFLPPSKPQGDISSNFQVSVPFSSFEEMQPIRFGGETAAYHNAQDPTMSQQSLDPDYQKSSRLNDKATDELYHKILRDIGGLTTEGSDSILEKIEAELRKPRDRTGHELLGDRLSSKLSDGGDQKQYGGYRDSQGDGSDTRGYEGSHTQLHKAHREIKKTKKSGSEDGSEDKGKHSGSEKMDPTPDRASPQLQSRDSEYNYSMDSFIDQSQSMFSEREELVHLDDGVSQVDVSLSNVLGSQ